MWETMHKRKIVEWLIMGVGGRDISDSNWYDSGLLIDKEPRLWVCELIEELVRSYLELW